MKKCNFKPYEGKQPYIFVSYAHKDAAKVYPILEALNNRGFRIWYDDGIAPGSEWPENIAQHLDSCAVTLAFVSENSMASDNCRREITFALSRKKAFLSIMLEQSTLPLGMELQLSAQQCVMAYAYPDMSALIDKVCQCPDLAPCQTPPVVIQIEDPKPAPVPPAPSHKMKFSRPIPILMGSGIAAVVIILVVLLVIFLPNNSPTSPQDTTADPTSTQLSSSNSVVLAPGVEVDLDAAELTLTELTVTADTVVQLQKLKQLKNLTFDKCAFTVPLELNSSILTSLKFNECTGNQYLQKLDGLTALYTLRIYGSTLNDNDIPTLPLPKLNCFMLTGNQAFTDLSKLAGCEALDEVNIDDTGVSDLSPLVSLTDLAYISANGCPIDSIDCLASLERLYSLSFNNCQIISITEAFKSLRMSMLHFRSNPLVSVSGFDNLTILTDVDFGQTYLDNIACLEKSAATIHKANLSGLSSSFKYTVANCVNMQDLVIDGTPLYNCDAFSAMTGLKTLSAEGCSIGDTSGLNNCPQLHSVNLMNNCITDISFVANMDRSSFLTVDLTGNYITDVSSLPTDVYYEGLSLAVNPIDCATIPAVEGYMFLLSYNETLTVENITDSFTFSNVYLLDCPDDKKVTIEDVLTYKVIFTTLEEILG